MLNIHLCLVGIHISLVGGILLLYGSNTASPYPFPMLIGGLALTLFSLLNQLFPVPTGSDT